MRLIAENISGERGGEIIFSRVDFSLERGGSLVVTGPNGTGKSTLLRIVAGLLPPAEGTIRVEGREDDAGIGAVCHYLGHLNGMKTALTVRENLSFWQRFSGEPGLHPTDALDAVGLPGIGHLPFGYLSTGQRRRVAIARLLLNHRPVWLLDEPTAGLDKASEKRFGELMEEQLRGGGIVVAATHLPLGIEGAQELRLGGGQERVARNA
ncbi:MAG: heme ABC exporter ATP-binding protein CcmA [Rhizobiaceae bacterium]|nr:MAG: heme ABC exporter ATP-binding protein CcmA [Rhizobiaceae bacterium]